MTTVDDRPDVRPAPSGRTDLAIVVEAVDNIMRILSPALSPPIGEITDFHSAHQALRFAWGVLDRVLEGDAESVEHAISATDLVDLTRRLRRAEDVVRRMDGGARTNSLDLVRETLGGFEGVQSVSQLAQECPRAISQLGFDRGMLSLVDKSIWTPVSAHSAQQPEWANELVMSGQDAPQDLVPSLPEFDLLRRARSILVTDVQQSPQVYEEVVRASQSRSYVAARVVSNGMLVGFMHADKFYNIADVDETDRSILGLFAEAFGYVLARAMVINHSSAIQSRLASLTAGITQVAGDLGHFDVNLVREDSGKLDVSTVRTGSADISVANCGLTRRELQVLQLMANGASNVEISARLYIAPGTVKSHSKHILRKLGAANRAEAVSRWFSNGAMTAGQ